MLLVTKASIGVFKIPPTDAGVSLILILYLTALIVYSHFTCKFIEINGARFLQGRSMLRSVKYSSGS